MRGFWCVVLSLGLVFGTVGYSTVAHAGTLPVVQKDDKKKDDKDKKKDDDKEDKDDKNKSKESKENADLKKLEKELQPGVDAEAKRARDNYYRGDEFLQAYVNELGQSLVPKEAPADLYFSFRVINDVTPNAFALPDGRVFVHSGLLSFVDNEAQLAMVLGHEIGHVLKKHAALALKNSRSLKSGLLGGVLGGTVGR